MFIELTVDGGGPDFHEKIRVNVDHLVTYEKYGVGSRILISQNKYNDYRVLETPEQIDLLLTEGYHFVKRI
jgi:hypothetical protein